MKKQVSKALAEEFARIVSEHKPVKTHPGSKTALRLIDKQWISVYYGDDFYMVPPDYDLSKDPRVQS